MRRRRERELSDGDRSVKKREREEGLKKRCGVNKELLQ